MWQLAKNLEIYGTETDKRKKLVSRAAVEALRSPKPRVAEHA
jgi:hypothetical protein